MAATNPAYVPQAGDVFTLISPGISVKFLTVVSASGTKFVADDGNSYSTQSQNVSIYSSPNLSAVASVAASGSNGGSGAIAGVGFAAPAINLRQPYSGMNSAVSNANGQPYIISFVSTVAWQVLNAARAVIASGAYGNPTAITFLGITVQISGAPAAGDTFFVTPLA